MVLCIWLPPRCDEQPLRSGEFAHPLLGWLVGAQHGSSIVVSPASLGHLLVLLSLKLMEARDVSHQPLLAFFHALHLVLLCVCESVLPSPSCACLPASTPLIPSAAVLVFSSLLALRVLFMD